MQTIRDLFRGGKGWSWATFLSLALASALTLRLGAADERNLLNPEKPKTDKQELLDSGKPSPFGDGRKKLENDRLLPEKPSDAPQPEPKPEPRPEPKVEAGTPVIEDPVKVDVPADLQSIFAGGAPETAAQLKAMEAHVRTLVEKVTPCTVGVQIGPSQGSGVIISKDGYVLTAAHVTGKPGRDVTIVMFDGRRVKAKSLGTNHGIDSGLIKITDKGDWPHCEMGVSRDLKQGQWVLTTGHPGGYMEGRKPVVRLGRILQNRRTVIVSDCTLVGGDSGGPLFDMHGRVVGIHSRIGGQITANMHVPVDTYKETWARLSRGDDWGGETPDSGPYLGVSGDTEAPEARVGVVNPGSPAEKAGIRVGDVIVTFDGKEIPTFQALAIVVRSKKPGDKVKVVLKRGEETKEIELTIGDRATQ